MNYLLLSPGIQFSLSRAILLPFPATDRVPLTWKCKGQVVQTRPCVLTVHHLLLSSDLVLLTLSFFYSQQMNDFIAKETSLNLRGI